MKRSVPLKRLTYGVITPAGGEAVRREITLQQGIAIEKGSRYRQDHKRFEEEGAGFDPEETWCARVSAKDRDTLQEVIALLRGHDFGIDMQFTNYRTN